jgi:hypothetical protein
MLIIPGQLESYRSLKDRTLKLSFETSEPTPTQMAEVQQSLMTTGYLAFSTDNFTSDQIDSLKEIKVDYDDPTRTPSKRLRAVLYLLHKQNPEGFDTAQRYYDHYLEKIIAHYKSKFDE